MCIVAGILNVVCGQRGRPARRAAALDASARAPPPPPSHGRTRCAPPASSRFLARRDHRKSRSIAPFYKRRRFLIFFTCAHRCCSRLLYPPSVCLSLVTHVAGLYWCFSLSFSFCSARTCLLSHRSCTLSTS